jgi:hypothetical protein
MHEIRGLVQVVVKYDRVNDLATTGATKTRDADLTRVVLKVQIVLLAPPPTTRTAATAGLRRGAWRMIVRRPA